MEFKGFDVSSVGNARLEIVNDCLRVYNEGNTGLDGVVVHAWDKRRAGYSIHYSDMKHVKQHNATIRSSSMLMDDKGQVTVIAETIKRYDAMKKNAVFGFNGAFLQNDFKIIGKLEGKEVFVIEENGLNLNSKAPKPQVIPWPFIIKIGEYALAALDLALTGWDIYERIKSEQTVEVHPIYHFSEDTGELHIIGYDVTVTYDPEPFPIEIGRTKFTIDTISVAYRGYYPKPQKELKHHLVGEQVTLHNIPYIDIENIIAI